MLDLTLMKISGGLEIMLNITDCLNHDTAHHYEFQLDHETASVEDIHRHLIKLRAIRISERYQF
ncbi:hypothetical protein [Pseudoalteromonas luteoviolacea]|uniref:Uncharacterized protein n=1 Tax=Pseudoalteromonas luteoviolacea S4054 TaxID=1129367 RepID=A0A0F6AF21_9GAMM|nr:hypothetical protein [Pseudoalteromonas luteoviolacea]AOT08057.1 hypothetical protein S4054249_09450 [Pseudoalteromonas luteoviolacea]AOT12974.1 hypothetical protein S40542_09450 [Pseudoalteromonas luteoviolacea]AOT17886.1 hypothetical protein S4054_09445 [Pseudoalteromonas luteoviolacea]KKE84391.1 hypothetical protein N479_09115 [Pseudoalteromonas luteoviolacea S4054]KZN71766.1 hypothetical protein N481_17655 [Pseudoalteromonas luteoviolacea S4047-1]